VEEWSRKRVRADWRDRIIFGSFFSERLCACSSSVKWSSNHCQRRDRDLKESSSLVDYRMLEQVSKGELNSLNRTDFHEFLSNPHSSKRQFVDLLHARGREKSQG